jgi:hypothetical protein
VSGSLQAEAQDTESTRPYGRAPGLQVSAQRNTIEELEKAKYVSICAMCPR